MNEGIEKAVWQSAVRYPGNFLHARLHLLTFVSVFGAGLDKGGFGRYSAAYDIADALTLTAGLFSYGRGKTVPLWRYRRQ